MALPYLDRTEAGHALASQLAPWANRPDVNVYAPANGGIPVAVALSGRLGLPWSAMPVQWVETGNGETRVAAIMDDGVTARAMGIPGNALSQAAIDSAFRRTGENLQRRLEAFAAYPPHPAEGKTAIVVDDGIVTGTSMLAMSTTLRRHGAARVLIAAPVASVSAISRLETSADEIICLEVPRPFHGIEECYIHLPKLQDADTLAQLAAVSQKTA